MYYYLEHNKTLKHNTIKCSSFDIIYHINLPGAFLGRSSGASFPGTFPSNTILTHHPQAPSPPNLPRHFTGKPGLDKTKSVRTLLSYKTLYIF